MIEIFYKGCASIPTLIGIKDIKANKTILEVDLWEGVSSGKEIRLNYDKLLIEFRLIKRVLIKLTDETLLGIALLNAIEKNKINQFIIELKEQSEDAPGQLQKILGKELFNQIKNY
jgi:hypothetical protein